MENQDLASQEKVNSSKTLLVLLATAICIIVLATIGLTIYQNYFSPKAQALQTLDKITKLIQNPDPKLIQKYQVSSVVLNMDQTMLVCGYKLDDTQNNKKCSPNSLKGIKENIRNGEFTTAQKDTRTMFDSISKRGLGNGEGGERIMSASEAKQIDPDHIFLFFAADVPNAKPGSQDKASYTGSMVKQVAAFETIKLWYMLKNIR